MVPAQARRLHRARLGAWRRLLLTPAVPCAAGYAWSKDGSNQCPTSYYAIVNAAACESAAMAAGKAYFGSWTVPYFPSGCFFFQRYGGIYFNADTVGADYRGTQLLCSGAALLARPDEALSGYYGGKQVCRIGAQGGARRGTRLDGCARPPCLGSRAAVRACQGCSGYSTVRLGTHRVLTTCTTRMRLQRSRPPERPLRPRRRMRRTVLPRGRCGGPAHSGGPRSAGGLHGHGGSPQPRPWQAPLNVDAVPRVQGARCRLR
jgi:hypothetical protein